MAKANYPIDPIEQVRRGKARYCRFVDTRQWDELAALFVPEPTIEMLDPDGNTIAAFSRREEFASVVRNFLDGARSSHHLHNAEIDIVSEREITAIWAMEDIVVNPDPGPIGQRGCTATATIKRRGSAPPMVGASRGWSCAAPSSKSPRIKGISP